MVKAPTVWDHLNTDSVYSDPVLVCKFFLSFFPCTVTGVVGQPLIEGVYNISKGLMVSEVITD